jgi:glycosyltransferase involved in cell wall biosynthesis
MNIAYFNANMKRGQDGVTRVIYTMIDGARERGHRVMAITSTLPDPPDRIIPMVQVPSIALPLQKVYRVAFPCYQTFAKQLRDFQPDILHINSPCPLGFVAEVYARDFNIPIVATYHTHFPAYTKYYKLEGLEELAWKIMKKFYNNVDRTFVPALPILEELAEHDLHGLHYLPNGVDLGLFNPKHRSEEWRNSIAGETDTPIILFVSRLVWEKDLADLAGMYNILRNKRNDFTMVIVGEGQARSEFEAMMPEAKFLGFQSGETLARSYASSDIFVFPSTTETFGLVTVEAMASGTVPVAARIGGAMGIIQEGTSGLFSQPHDPAGMAHQVELLLDYPDQRAAMAAGARHRAQDFGWTRILDRLFEHYADVGRMHNYLRHRYVA